MIAGKPAAALDLEEVALKMISATNVDKVDPLLFDWSTMK